MSSPNPLSIEELNERWGLEPGSDAVMDLVRAGRLKPFPVTNTPQGRSKPGPKSIRFRVAEVERYEREEEMSFAEIPASVPGPAPAPPIPMPALPGWDGKVRGRRPRAAAKGA